MTGKRVNAAAMMVAAALVAGLIAGSAGAVTRESRDPINIELGVHGGERGVFVPGSEVAFYVKPSEDCYLAVYNIDARGRVALLYPRSPEENARVEGGERIRVPERGADYRLYLGNEPGTEYVIAVASADPMDLTRWFPGGNFGAADEIYQDEELDRQGLDQADWVQQDPHTAMDLIEDRLVPASAGEGRWGQSYVSLRVGGATSQDEASASASPVTRVEVVHEYAYAPSYWGGAWWGGWGSPWWYGSGYYSSVSWCDPCWPDPWFGPWYGPWYGYNVGIGWSWGGGGWDGGDRRHHHDDHWSDGGGPNTYWGSRVKWKTLPGPSGGGGGTKWKNGSVALASASPAIGVQTPPVRMKVARIEPGRTRTTRQAPRATRYAGEPVKSGVTRVTSKTPEAPLPPSPPRAENPAPRDRERVKESRDQHPEQPRAQESPRGKSRSEDKRGGGSGDGGGKRRR